MRTPKISLVGAGPGDLDLITVKGLQAIQQADVILYDALVNIELLNYAKPEVTCIFVGKRAGNHAYPQNEINKMLVEYAFSHGHVVRLKGGDPFVFGRGYEELEYAEAFGIEVSIVPGISSSTSLPALQRVPLTMRGINESFWVLTATTRNGQLSKDISLAAQSTATVIILMGMRKLPQIVAEFSKYDKADTPVMIIQNGSTPDEKLGIGKVNNITEVVKDKGLSSPAIIVIGEVVSLHPALKGEYIKAAYMQEAQRLLNQPK
ncbi:MAG: uroporphyrinogen-III C-methyltransferase [Flammeovirgaceae bacterium]